MIVMQTLRKFEINIAKYKIYYDVFMSILSVGYVISFVMQSKVDFSEPEARIGKFLWNYETGNVLRSCVS
jgi:hypothetical protein